MNDDHKEMREVPHVEAMALAAKLIASGRPFAFAGLKNGLALMHVPQTAAAASAMRAVTDSDPARPITFDPSNPPTALYLAHWLDRTGKQWTEAAAQQLLTQQLNPAAMLYRVGPEDDAEEWRIRRVQRDGMWSLELRVEVVRASSRNFVPDSPYTPNERSWTFRPDGWTEYRDWSDKVNCEVKFQPWAETTCPKPEQPPFRPQPIVQNGVMPRMVGGAMIWPKTLGKLTPYALGYRLQCGGEPWPEALVAALLKEVEEVIVALFRHPQSYIEVEVPLVEPGQRAPLRMRVVVPGGCRIQGVPEDVRLWTFFPDGSRTFHLNEKVDAAAKTRWLRTAQQTPERSDETGPVDA